MSIRYVSGRDFLTKETKFEWVIYPFVTLGSNMMIFGKPGLGKSSLAKQIAHSVGTGDPWLGFPVMHRGKTLYLGLDMADMEEQLILERCEASGLKTVDYLILPRPPEGEDGLDFNIFDDECVAGLRELCERERPVVVVVDAIQDAYQAPYGSHDINQLIRDVIKRFRGAIGNAVLVMLNHQRKSTVNYKTGEEVDDPDSYMGGTAFSAKVSANLQLRVVKNKKHLTIHKTRLAKPPMTDFELKEMGVGFFEVEDQAAHMLMMWPHCIQDREKREWAEVNCKTQASVFRVIGEMTGLDAETVKKRCQRAVKGGAHFKWLEEMRES